MTLLEVDFTFILYITIYYCRYNHDELSVCLCKLER